MKVIIDICVLTQLILQEKLLAKVHIYYLTTSTNGSYVVDVGDSFSRRSTSCPMKREPGPVMHDLIIDYSLVYSRSYELSIITASMVPYVKYVEKPGTHTGFPFRGTLVWVPGGVISKRLILLA